MKFKSLGDKINEYSLFTIGWQPRIIKNDNMKTIAIKIWYEYLDEGKPDEVKSVAHISDLMRDI